MIIVVGEVLYDVFDEYERMGGAPFNFAFHLKQLGLPVRLLTRVGDDKRGMAIRRRLADNGFDLADVQVDADHPTGTVRVRLDDKGVPQFDIRTDVAYDHLALDGYAPEIGPSADMVYIGSLVQRTSRVFQGMQRLMGAKRNGAEVFCDINLRPPHYQDATVAACLRYADILKLNTDELRHIQTLYGGPATGTADWLMERFGVHTLVLTHGAEGSTLYRGGREISAVPAGDGPVVDTVGAGDAYAAVVAAGFYHNCDLQPVVDLATRFAAFICTLPGAVPDDPAVYLELRRKLEGKNHVR